MSIIFTILEITLIMINYWIKVKATSGNEDRAVRLILNFSELKEVAGDLSVSFNLPSSVKLSLNFYLDMVSPFSPRCSVQEIINVLHIANRALLLKKNIIKIQVVKKSTRAELCRGWSEQFLLSLGS